MRRLGRICTGYTSSHRLSPHASHSVPVTIKRPETMGRYAEEAWKKKKKEMKTNSSHPEVPDVVGEGAAAGQMPAV